ncbi:SIR2 family NAD-dependent protein deacylase [Alloprevotella tannerae]|uniref:SIR2 family NAD-dependent protein deacylase n=1 Tax=Alloprevotella tannerae TaxID=76122 RepID=UPI0025ECFF53|nr:NAD-dependent deacylase [Alloprevotella tannerae]
MRQKLVILSGAGMSAESGFSTFRDAGGLWEQYPVEQVATPEGWRADPNLVTDFYNQLRRQLIDAQPNEGHRGLVALENQFDVTIVTQNVDDLHERAGSSHVIHLHGELMKACSSRDPDNPRLWQTLTRERIDVAHGEQAADGSLLRPWIVWFGEAVPKLEQAAEEVAKADIFVIIGSSLNVYPAAGLVRHVPKGAQIFLIDPAEVRVPSDRPITILRLPASEGVKELRRCLLPKSEI